jgi:hypothetical protein
VTIKRDLGEMGCNGMDWILAQGREARKAFVNAVINLLFP